jgi:hypothetical protein
VSRLRRHKWTVLSSLARKEQEGSTSFLKKRSKKLLLIGLGFMTAAGKDAKAFGSFLQQRTFLLDFFVRTD